MGQDVRLGKGVIDRLDTMSQDNMTKGAIRMTRKDENSYSKKHPGGYDVNPEIKNAVEAKTSDGKITCAATFKVAADLNVTPLEVGMALDSLEIKIIKCQMGIFGYGPGKTPIKVMDGVGKELKGAIEGELKEGRLSCKIAWEIAARLNVTKVDITSACNCLRIKISPCQLGAF